MSRVNKYRGLDSWTEQTGLKEVKRAEKTGLNERGLNLIKHVHGKEQKKRESKGHGREDRLKENYWVSLKGGGSTERAEERGIRD